MDVPVSLGLAIAFAGSVWATVTGHGEVYYDSVVMFVFFLLTGRYFELAGRKRAAEVSEALVHMLPVTATRLVNGEQEAVPASELASGDLVLVRPGESIPADGVVHEGRSSVDESLLSGESLPLAKAPGAVVIGGSINIESPLTLRVEKTGEDTVLSAIRACWIARRLETGDRRGRRPRRRLVRGTRVAAGRRRRAVLDSLRPGPLAADYDRSAGRDLPVRPVARDPYCDHRRHRPSHAPRTGHDARARTRNAGARQHLRVRQNRHAHLRPPAPARHTRTRHCASECLAWPRRWNSIPNIRSRAPCARRLLNFAIPRRTWTAHRARD
jgi:hypothetical protein